MANRRHGIMASIIQNVQGIMLDFWHEAGIRPRVSGLGKSKQSAYWLFGMLANCRIYIASALNQIRK